MPKFFMKSQGKKISDIPGVFNIHNDIFVFGKDKKHDVALEKVFERLHVSGLTLNKQKAAFLPLVHTLYSEWYEP